MIQDILDRRRKTYFFANDDEFVEFYDTVDELVQPILRTIHDLMIDLVVEALKGRYGHGADQDPSILVVGSGTGAEVLRIIRRVPNARMVAIDFSTSMNEQLRTKFAAEFSERDFGSAVVLLERDFLSAGCTPESMMEVLGRHFQAQKFDAAVMGFVTHHYSAEQKFEFYRRITAVLIKGGSLVHGDLFDYRSDWLSKISHEMGERWIRKQLSEPEPELQARFAKVRHISSQLREAWINHWNSTHIYASVHGRPIAALDPVGPSSPSHMSMLRELGFSEIECPFRLWEAGVIWARL